MASMAAVGPMQSIGAVLRKFTGLIWNLLTGRPISTELANSLFAVVPGIAGGIAVMAAGHRLSNVESDTISSWSIMPAVLTSFVFTLLAGVWLVPGEMTWI